MYCVGLDVDTNSVVCKSNFIQNNWAICGEVLLKIWTTHKIMLGKIQILKQSAGNQKISDHLNKYRKPESDEELGWYLAGLIESDGYCGENRLEII